VCFFSIIVSQFGNADEHQERRRLSSTKFDVMVIVVATIMKTWQYAQPEKAFVHTIFMRKIYNLICRQLHVCTRTPHD
jgi:hypothetical protein